MMLMLYVPEVWSTLVMHRPSQGEECCRRFPCCIKEKYQCIDPLASEVRV